MRFSARNVLPGIVIEIAEGAVNSHIRLDIGGRIITAAITNEAVR